ncbi:hypothetical protein BL253_25080 [Pseudofrankia asymbiotica]|uniref:Uncharacterized protein n=1 Tax=Pseudofrankia asymbiotica TaxID=1834516 RepID=A0A1V2I5T6_9ACTN|nr:hypothetical protein BL253_25080 [Pseudofrankia asymbiotica]
MLAWLTGADEDTPTAHSAGSIVGPPSAGLRSNQGLPGGVTATSAGPRESGHPLAVWLTALLAAILVGIVAAGVVRWHRGRPSMAGNADKDGFLWSGAELTGDLGRGVDRMAVDPYPDLPPVSGSATWSAIHLNRDVDDGRDQLRPRFRPAKASKPTAGTDLFSTRMNRLAVEFVFAVVPRPGRETRIDLDAPATQSFLAAFTHATDVFLAPAPQDRRLMSAALGEAEHRWLLVERGSGDDLRGDQGDGCRPQGP